MLADFYKWLCFLSSFPAVHEHTGAKCNFSCLLLVVSSCAGRYWKSASLELKQDFTVFVNGPLRPIQPSFSAPGPGHRGGSLSRQEVLVRSWSDDQATSTGSFRHREIAAFLCNARSCTLSLVGPPKTTGPLGKVSDKERFSKAPWWCPVFSPLWTGLESSERLWWSDPWLASLALGAVIR